MPSQHLRIAIVGGGIGGVAFAVALSRVKRDVVVDIYESKQTYSEIGAGVGMWPRVWETMRALGLEEGLKRELGAFPGGGKFQYRKSDQREGFTFGSSSVEVQTIHRADLLKVLVQNTPSNYNTHFSKRLMSYVDKAPGPIILKFSDGTTATCDILVGADGINSSVRENMYNSLATNAESRGSSKSKADQFRRHASARWSGQTIYRSIIPKGALTSFQHDHPSLSMPVEYMGKDRMILTYPISQGNGVNAAAIVFQHHRAGELHEGPQVVEADNRELAGHFVGWEPAAQSIIRLMGRSSRWRVNTVIVPSFVSGRVALLGDAASGAGQAVEDAVVLSCLLSQEQLSPRTLPLALQVYDEVRRPIAQEVQRRSLEAGKAFSFNGRSMSGVSREESAMGLASLEALQDVNRELDEISHWTWTSVAAEDRDTAIRLFRQRLGLA